MAQNEESLSESNSNVNSNGEPLRRFSITLEFSLFLTMLALSLSGAAVNNILLYRTCVHSLNHSKSECEIFLEPEKSNISKEFEEEVQKYATYVFTIRSVIEALAPACLSLFLGVWSDTHGRKPLIVWPLWGLTISSMAIVVYSMLDQLGPWWYILTAIPISLTGGFTILFTGAFCYISDMISTGSRSFRMTLLEIFVSAGSVVGYMFSSYLLEAIGNVYLMLTSSAILVVAYASANIFLVESLAGAVKGGLCSVMDILLVKEMVTECFKRRPNHGRAQILLLAFANSTLILIMYGLFGVEFYYSREKISWSLKEYNIYSAANTVISSGGAFLGLALFQKLLNISDLMVATIALASTALEYLIKAFATTTLHMYIAAAVAIFRSLSSPLIRSMLTKMLPVEDIAKVFAFISAVEGVCPLLGPVIYLQLYRLTITAFPGAVYVLSSVITWSCVVMVGLVQYYRWNLPSTYQPLTSEVLS